MYKNNKKNLKSYLDFDLNARNRVFASKTLTAVIRSLLEPLANSNVKSLIFTRFKNTKGIEGIIKRLEYCSNVEMFSFLDPDVVKKDDLVETEFIILTSNRYNAALVWDFSDSPKKDETMLYLRVNSKDVNDIYEAVKDNAKMKFDDAFYSFRPERRENNLLNDAVFNVLKLLDDNVKENDFTEKEQVVLANKAQNENILDEINANVRHASHEIKNQLSILDIYSKILEKQLGANNNLALIKKSIAQIRLQLDDLRAHDNLNLEERKISEIIKSSIEIFEQIIGERNNKIKFVDETSGDVEIFADEERFFAILNNIVKNADESTSDDEIEIKLQNDEKYAKIFVKNHGEAISDELQAKLFKENFSTKKEGWGVGLKVCKKYLAQMLGSIKLVKSDENETEFLITIPLSSWGKN